MSGRASAGQVKSLALQVGDGVPSDILEVDASRNLSDMSQIHVWLRLGLTTDLSQVDMAAVEALMHPKILEFVTTVMIPALPVFDVAAHFRVTSQNERKTAEVPISWIGNYAQKLVQGRTEPETAKTTLHVHKLLRASVDGPIIAELGGDQAVTTTWGQMYEMMRCQDRGQEGVLLTNGRVNIFYIPTADGVSWAVRCRWEPICGYWCVNAAPVTDPFRWDADNQVVSR